MNDQAFSIPDPIKSYDPATNSFTCRSPYGDPLWSETAEVEYIAQTWTDQPSLQRINDYWTNNSIHQREYGLKLAANYIRKKYGPKRKPIVKVQKTQTGWLWTCRICDHFFMSTKWSIIIKTATHHAHNHHRSE